MFDKQKIILFFTKYMAYAINICLIGAVGYVVYFWINTLVTAAKS